MTDEPNAEMTGRIGGWRRHLVIVAPQQGFPAGSILAYHLAQLVDPADVIFSEWASGEGSGFDVSTGSLFALVPGHALRVSWTDVPTDQNVIQRPSESQRLAISFHPLTKLPTVRLETKQVHPQYSSTDARVVTIDGDGWTQTLPYSSRYQLSASAFLQEVRQALAEAYSSPNNPIAAN